MLVTWLEDHSNAGDRQRKEKDYSSCLTLIRHHGTELFNHRTGSVRDKMAVLKFDYFLRNCAFVTFTDHKSLTHLDQRKFNNAKIRRWQEEISCYKFVLEYVAGKSNVCADMPTSPHGLSSSLLWRKRLSRKSTNTPLLTAFETSDWQCAHKSNNLSTFFNSISTRLSLQLFADITLVIWKERRLTLLVDYDKSISSLFLLLLSSFWLACFIETLSYDCLFSVLEINSVHIFSNIWEQIISLW